MPKQLYHFGLVCSVLIGWLTAGQTGLAQMTPDRTTPTSVRGDCQASCTIRGGRASRNNNNLFHSFQTFNIRAGETVIFDDPGVNTILTRVTGNRRSLIRGTLSINGSANLFLLNPNGIVFSDDATLDVAGSFVATTANAIGFGQQGEFSASDTTTNLALLTVNPSAFFFLQPPAPIQNQAFLEVPDGESLLLVGGKIDITGGGSAPDGRIELASLAGTGTIGLAGGNSLRLRSPNDDISFADITLNNALIDVASGTTGIWADSLTLNSSELLASSEGESVAGTIAIQLTDRLALTDSSITTESLGREDAGTINIRANQQVSLRRSSISSETYGDGNGGMLTIQTGTLSLFEDSDITATTLSAGNAGTVSVQADQIQLQDSLISSTADSVLEQVGNAGVVRIHTNELILRDRAGVTTSTVDAGGTGGGIEITAIDVSLQNESYIEASTTSQGRGGNIDINARTVEISDRSRIAARTIRGDGGNIRLQNLDQLTLRRNSRISTEAGTDGEGNGGSGGDITIDADLILTIPLENSDIVANAFDGRGGNIRITAQSLFNIEERPSTPDNLTNDIDASSTLGIDGVIEINKPDVDPTQGLTALPTDVVDATRLIARSCRLGEAIAQERGEFVITGRGGLPPSPTDARYAETILTDWAMLASDTSYSDRSHSDTDHEGATSSEPFPATIPDTPPVEAQGWMMSDRGEVILTAQPPQLASHHPIGNTNCQRRAGHDG